MQTVLFHSTIFGPIHSRRLGSSLGINLMPADGKVCSFDCLYCEAGFNAQGPGKAGLPSRAEVARLLEEKLQQMKKSGEPLDVITFSGNGEPTLHPDFAGVIDDTIRLRDRYFPTVKISVLTNSTRIGDNQVADALRRIDNNILKLDSAIDGTVQRLDRPNSPDYSVERVISELSQFKETGIIQTMILRGEHDGNTIDNTTETEISALIDAYRQIRPRSIMLYSIDRKTPAERLHKVEADELKAIADRIMAETSIPVTTA
ncbi:MAG: radical SAM protein [Muribaculaceae bacterium]|nr:radical SAM protein [Muribaculaceae bacterium]MDE6510432.1 radical SAM protein [Muribaculaceae bacterium]